MNAVVDGVISLHVPAVIVLIHAVSMNPHDGGMLHVFIDVFWDEEPAGNLLAVGSAKMHKLRLDELRAVHTGRHGVCEAYRLRAGIGADGIEVGAIVRVRVLIDQAAVAFRPVWLDVCSWFSRNVGDFSVR